MDALSEILKSTRLTGGVFLRGEFTEPWCLASAVTAADCARHLGPADHLVIYHFVAAGALTIGVAGMEETFLPGQIAVLPRNDRHTLSGAETAAPVSALDVARIPGPNELMVIDHGGGGAATHVVCGFLGAPSLSGDPLLGALPSLLKYDCASARSGDVVRTSLEFAASEVADGRPGADVMLARLSELLFVETVRAYVESLPEDVGGLLAALNDPALSRALAAIHGRPAEKWTAESLGREAGLSRSSLADRFAQNIGMPPAEYLAAHRMRLAARELAVSAAPLIEIAERVGYGSEPAFSRAFKRAHGVSPGAWRRRHKAASAR